MEAPSEVSQAVNGRTKKPEVGSQRQLMTPYMNQTTELLQSQVKRRATGRLHNCTRKIPCTQQNFRLPTVCCKLRHQREPYLISRQSLTEMMPMSRALAVLCALLLASASVQAARTLQQSTCTVKLTGGLDPIAGKTDITLSHNCGTGFAQTNKVAGELVDFYRDSTRKCLFQDGKYEWCISMEDGGGWHINAALFYGGFSKLTTCSPSSDIQMECDWTGVPSNTIVN